MRRMWAYAVGSTLALAALLAGSGLAGAAGTEPAHTLTIDAVVPINAAAVSRGRVRPATFAVGEAVKVSGVVPDPSGAWLQWRVLDASQVAGLRQDDDRGTAFWVTPVRSHTSSSLVVQLPPFPPVLGPIWLDVAEYSLGPLGRVRSRLTDTRRGVLLIPRLRAWQPELFTEIAGESPPVPVSHLPYGQLPEAPWAAALPVAGVGAWIAVRRWRRLQTMP